jgi:AcrR family transcriptional regulator
VAAQKLIATGRATASIQEITELAGIGFGSFYNHFATKDDLFAAAVADALDRQAEARDRAVVGLTDPAEIFARSFRTLGRLQRAQPQIVKVLLNSGAAIMSSHVGLRERALADIRQGAETGRFLVPDAETALMLVAGALLGLLQLLDSRPELDDGRASDDAAELVLQMLGVSTAEARELAHGPLPS